MFRAKHVNMMDAPPLAVPLTFQEKKENFVQSINKMGW
jgi:hypothetical protein